MTPEQKFSYHYLEMMKVCNEQEWGDPFSYARAKEIYMANELGHRVASTLSGADGYNKTGQPVEYKSTIAKSVKGTYNGISVQDSWSEQESYLLNNKLGCYPEHFISRFDRETGKIEELWMLTGDKVCDILIPKLSAKFPTVRSKKDPRLGANITKKEIHEHGKRIK
tara:strand:- start:85 stop:585 length:501 start_codon:yes stop_codon:yes gene_type:complete